MSRDIQFDVGASQELIRLLRHFGAFFVQYLHINQAAYRQLQKEVADALAQLPKQKKDMSLHQLLLYAFLVGHNFDEKSKEQFDSVVQLLKNILKDCKSDNFQEALLVEAILASVYINREGANNRLEAYRHAKNVLSEYDPSVNCSSFQGYVFSLAEAVLAEYYWEEFQQAKVKADRDNFERELLAAAKLTVELGNPIGYGFLARYHSGDNLADKDAIAAIYYVMCLAESAPIAKPAVEEAHQKMKACRRPDLYESAALMFRNKQRAEELARRERELQEREKKLREEQQSFYQQRPFPWHQPERQQQQNNGVLYGAIYRVLSIFGVAQARESQQPTSSWYYQAPLQCEPSRYHK